MKEKFINEIIIGINESLKNIDDLRLLGIIRAFVQGIEQRQSK